MSKIFLSNGGTIEVYTPWKQTTNDDGTILLHDHGEGENRKFLGIISVSGVVHLTHQCNYRHYPPEINNKDKAFDIVSDSLKTFSDSKLRQLKKQLERYNAKTGYWK